MKRPSALRLLTGILAVGLAPAVVNAQGSGPVQVGFEPGSGLPDGVIAIGNPSVIDTPAPEGALFDPNGFDYGRSDSGTVITATNRGGDGISISSAFTIVINAGPGLSGNAAALGAFQRAAQQWADRFTDPITVTIDADLANLGDGGIIGQASSFRLVGGYDTVRDLMIADADADDGIVASLPTFSNFNAWVNAGNGLTGNSAVNKANLKALGVDGLDVAFGASDGEITFNSQFAFDFDNSNGVTPGFMDFETVAAHEIGHVLGFVSEVDTADYYGAFGVPVNLNISTADMFRFWKEGDDPTNAAEFTTAGRLLYAGTGATAITDDIDNEWGMSTGAFIGDGRQASHWKDDDLTGTFIGMTDPTLGFGEVRGLSYADLRMMDLIGYNITFGGTIIPEPATLAQLAMGLAGVGLAVRRYRPRRVA